MWSDHLNIIRTFVVQATTVARAIGNPTRWPNSSLHLHANTGRGARTAVLILSLLLGNAASAQGNVPAQVGEVIADVVADNCGTQVLFLGEVNHGGGKTVEIKSAIVRELVLKCGFTHVAFEGQFYDFVDLQDKYSAGTATKEGLYDSIGGLWSMDAEIDELVAFLHGEAVGGRISISGIDGQTGGAMGYYSQRLLGTKLGSTLTGSRREFCVTQIDRLNGSKFDRENPKSAAFDSSLLDCAKEIEGKTRVARRHDPSLYQMARSYRGFLEFSSASLDRTDRGTLRDRLMYENLMWSIDRLPRNTKTVVWTANIHALRKPFGGMEMLASNAVRGGRLQTSSVVVVAIAGKYIAPDGRETEIPTADEESLEGRFAPEPGQTLSYANRSTLQSLGSVKSRAVGYERYIDENWGSSIDGMVVLASEVPPTYVRPRRPLQMPAESSIN